MNTKTLKYMLLRPFGDKNYGFIAARDLPARGYSSVNVPNLCAEWAATRDFSALAVNHCAAVAVTNLALYFAQNGCPELAKATYRDTFAAVHKIVGNGPVFKISGRAKEYFSGCGCALNCRPLADYDGIKAAVKNGCPCAVLLADGLLQWHWVLAVGYREYTSGEVYLRLVSGWHRAADRFYKPETGSVLLGAVEFWI